MIGISAEYAHPVEVLLSNFLPFFAAPYVIMELSELHLVTFCIYTVLRKEYSNISHAGVFETVDAHSGYEFPFSPGIILRLGSNATFHDYHHTHNIGNYGLFMFWDKLMVRS